jgi:hypothetical protein
MSRFNANYFDEEFYRGKGKGAIRDQDSPHYRAFAVRVDSCLRAMEVDKERFKVLDVGCGVGWEVKHYMDMGYDTAGADVSKWAHEHCVIPEWKHTCIDVRKLDTIYPADSIDLVIANRILAYLPKSQAMRGVEQLVKVSRKHILCAIICSDHKGEMVRKWAKGSGRLNIEPKQEWLKRFAKLGLSIDERNTTIMTHRGWDCIWWLRKEA